MCEVSCVEAAKWRYFRTHCGRRHRWSGTFR